MNKSIASYGELSVLSFNGNKIMTTSAGGALLSDNAGLIAKARFLSTQARDLAPYYQHSQIGYNYRMSNILAGIGRGQLEVIEERVNKRRNNYFFYREKLEQIEGISFLEEPDESYFSNRWLTTILIDPAKTGKSYDTVQRELSFMSTETRPLWKPMHLQPVFSYCPAYLNGVSEKLFNHGLCLPSGSNLSEESIECLANILKNSLTRKSSKQRKPTIFERVKSLVN
jgi:dTDP-4-amino-4,6-dideoxygalactose transaminase